MKLAYCAIFLLTISNCYSQVHNSGFEDWAESHAPNKISNWFWEESNYKISIDSINAHSGGRCILIDGTNQTGYSSFYQFVPSKIENAKKYRLSAYMKYQNVASGFVGLFVSVQGDDGPIYFDNMENFGINGNGDWAKYSVEFVSDETAEFVIIGGNLAGNGKAWFDEFTIVEVREGEPSAIGLAFLNEAFSIIRDNSIRRDSINFGELKSRLMITLSGVRITRDCYPSIKYLLNKLKDNHSHFMEPEMKSGWMSSSVPANTSFPSGEIVNENIGYLKITEFRSGNNQQITKYADSLQNLIDHIDKQKIIKGWIIDLRQNRGGNAYAMLAGIGPLLGNGICGYFIKSNGKSQALFYKNGKAGYGKRIMAKANIKKHKVLSIDSPVAILTSGKTESAGEVLTVSFKGRQRTKSFGEPTFGNTTNNEDFKLSDDSLIFLATSYYADREGHSYKGSIRPDFQSDQKTLNNSTELVVEKAITWIKDNQ